MKFSTFIDSLLADSTKSKIVNDLQAAKDEFTNHVVPCYKTFNDQFGEYQFNSPQLKQVQEMFDKDVDVKSRKNFVTASYSDALANMEERIDWISNLLEDNFAADIIKTSLTMVQINVMQLSELVSFTVRFSRRLLNYVVTLETNDVSNTEPKNAMKPAEINWIQQHLPYYFRALNILAMPKRQADKVFEAIPDVLLQGEGAKADDTERLVGPAADPFKLKFIPVMLNPFYHFGMRIAEYQAARYHEAKHEEQVIAAKILYLRTKLDGEQDAKRESIIERYEDLLSRATYKIHKIEQEAF